MHIFIVIKIYFMFYYFTLEFILSVTDMLKSLYNISSGKTMVKKNINKNMVAASRLKIWTVKFNHPECWAKNN